MKMEKYKATLLILALMRGHVFAVYQDMTWVMDMDHISYHPIYATEQFRFKYNIDVADTSHGVFIAYNSYSTVEHMGTHIDAPYHLYEDGLTMDKVPLEDLIGPLVKIDMQERAKQDSDAAITVKDLQDWEERNGKIPDGSFIIMSSGWDKFYGNNSRYVETEEEGGPTHSPGFGEEARGSFMGSAGQAQFAPVVAVLLAVMLAILMI